MQVSDFREGLKKLCLKIGDEISFLSSFLTTVIILFFKCYYFYYLIYNIKLQNI